MVFHPAGSAGAWGALCAPREAYVHQVRAPWGAGVLRAGPQWGPCAPGSLCGATDSGAHLVSRQLSSGAACAGGGGLF
jgi:hypothetical protein